MIVDNLSDIEVIFNDTIEVSGLTIEMQIYRRGVVCSIHIKFEGTVTTSDPVIYVLSDELRPLSEHRLLGYNSGNILIRPSGHVVVSCRSGNDFQGSHAQVGYSWLCKGLI